jgi:hypothetical protein
MFLTGGAQEGRTIIMGEDKIKFGKKQQDENKNVELQMINVIVFFFFALIALGFVPRSQFCAIFLPLL